MTTNELHDKIQNCTTDTAVFQLLNILEALNCNVGRLERRVNVLEKEIKRTANIASCLANGIQPD